MKQTLEFAASELVGKIESGEIAPNACVSVTVDITPPLMTDEEVARRLAAWHDFVTKGAVSGVVVDDSREGISGQDMGRG